MTLRMAALLAMAWSGAAGAQLLPCTPPVDRALLLVSEQALWTADGKPLSVRIERKARLQREDGGWLLAVDAPLVRSTLGGAAAQRLAAGYRGLRPLRLHLGPDGAVLGMDDQAGHWAALLDRLADPRGPGGSARAGALRARLAAMPAEAQRQTLAGFWLPHVRFCGQWLADAVPAEGNRLIVSQTDETVPGVRSETRFTLDAATGLARLVERTMTPASAPGRPQRDRWIIEDTAPEG